MEVYVTIGIGLVTLVAIGCVVSYVILHFALRSGISERLHGTEDDLIELMGALKALEARVAELSDPAVLVPPVAPVIKTKAASSVAIESAARESGGVTPDVLVVIAAAVTAFLGKKVRIRSAKILQPAYQAVNPWSQQGRVFVHASHNPRLRG